MEDLKLLVSPIAIYDIATKKLVLVIRSSYFCARIITNIERKRLIDVSRAIAKKVKIKKNIFNRTIVLRFATTEQAKLIKTGEIYTCLDTENFQIATKNVLK